MPRGVYKHKKGYKIKDTTKWKYTGNGFKKGNQLSVGRARSDDFKKSLQKMNKGRMPWNKGRKGIYSDNVQHERAMKKVKKLEKITKRTKPEYCDICKMTGKICFDHDHKTGKFRGWICNRRNLILGLAKDDSELLLKLSRYVK